MPRQPSALDRALITLAAEAGVRLTARQLARWRADGYIPTPVRSGRGRGLGVSTSHPPDVASYIVELARRVQRSQPVYETVLWLVIDGVDVPEQCVRRAYTAVIRAFLTATIRLADSIDPLDGADAFASLGHYSKGSSAAIALREGIKRNYDDLKAEEHWRDVVLQDDKPSRAQHVHDSFFSLFLAATAPDLLADDNLYVLARTFLEHGSLNALRDLGAEIPEPAAFVAALSQYGPAGLEHAALTIDIEIIRATASDLRTQQLIPAWRVQEGVCPRPEVLLAPLFIAILLPFLVTAMASLKRTSDEPQSP